MEQRLYVSPVAVGSALAGILAVAFVLCALLVIVAPTIAFSHVWLSLFTSAPIGSGAAWFGGVLSSVIAGFVLGPVFAWIYNRVAR